VTARRSLTRGQHRASCATDGNDALQLGAALAVAEDQPASLQVVTLDDRLAQTAEREGFRIVNPDRG